MSDADLERVHDPLMSPLAWDLGHIAAYEDLWVCHRTGGLDLLRPELAELYDAFETPRATRGDIPFLRRREALDYLEGVRERSLEVLAATDPEHFVWQLVAQHEHQHDETMLQTLQLAEPGVFAPERAAARGSRGGRQHDRARAARSTLGDAGARVRLRQRAAPAPRASWPRSRSTGRRSRTPPFSSSWTTTATGGPSSGRRRAGRTASGRAGSGRSTGPRTRPSAASTASSSSSRTCP